jgi:hypothetical protein
MGDRVEGWRRVVALTDPCLAQLENDRRKLKVQITVIRRLLLLLMDE